MDHLQKYEEWLKLRYRDTTVSTYLREIHMFIEWWGVLYDKTYSPTEVIPMDISEYKQYLMNVAKNKQGKRLSMITVNKKIESLRNYFHYLTDELKILNQNPIYHLKTQRIHSATMSEPRWLDRNEKNRFMRVIDDISEKKPNQSLRNRAICYLMLKAGLRISEVICLRLDDIELNRGILTVQDGKGGKMRRVTINKDVIKALQEWLDVRGEQGTDVVFISQKRTPITRQGIGDFFKKIKKEANIDELTPHVLRHTFCHDLIEKGYSINLVADMAGHQDINTTRIYTKSSEEERRKAAESLSASE